MVWWANTNERAIEQANGKRADNGNGYCVKIKELTSQIHVHVVDVLVSPFSNVTQYFLDSFLIKSGAEEDEGNRRSERKKWIVSVAFILLYWLLVHIEILNDFFWDVLAMWPLHVQSTAHWKWKTHKCTLNSSSLSFLFVQLYFAWNIYDHRNWVRTQCTERGRHTTI